MLSVYLDESGTHRDSKVCVVAGLVASPSQWERLTRSWQSILTTTGIPDFHAADCANGGGVFKGWNKQDRDRLYVRLVNLSKRMVAYRVWTAVVIEDHHSIFKDSKEKFPYSLCALGCASRLRWLAEKRGAGFAIPYVFDRGEKGKWAFAAFGRLLESQEKNVFRMGSLCKGDRFEMLPLQAADLHAYEVYRYFSDQLSLKKLPVRGSFMELLRIPDAGGYFMNGDKLMMLTRGIVRQSIEGRNDPIDIPVDYLDRQRHLKVLPPLPPGLKE